MATSDVSICNQALQLVGAKSIVNLFPPDNTKEGRECAKCYIEARDALARSHTWNCTTVRKELPADATNPINAYSFRYARSEAPKDIRVWTVNEDPENGILSKPFQVEGRFILTDETAPIIAKFTKQLLDPTEMDPLFEESLVYEIAKRVSYTLTSNRSLRQELAVEARNVINNAKSQDGQEGTTYDLWKDDLSAIRRIRTASN